MLLIQGGMSPTKTAKQIGLGRSTLYRELARERSSAEPMTSTSTNTDVDFEK